MKLYSTETERDLIGQLLLDPDSFGSLENLKADHFYSDNLATVYKAIEKINSDGNTADLLTVQDRLKQCGELDKIGGVTYLIDLQEKSISSALINQSEKRIIEYFKKRTLSQSLKDIISRIEKTGSDEIQSEIMATLQRLEMPDSGGFRNAEDLCYEFINDLDRQKSNAVKTNYYDFDRLTGGLKPGDYLIIAAATSMGKTSLALGMAYNITVSGIPVGIISLEMP